MYPILFRIPFPASLTRAGWPASLPIYSYGIMLGLSLILGWYLTLHLAERDGLNRDTMADCYVITAIAAMVGARSLYVVTNLAEFTTFSDVFALRRGGMVAYGGFLGGFAGSWGFLTYRRLPLLPWADVVVPSLASGLMITRIGCYLFGCDFGKMLPDNAPNLLKKLGTFPHWPPGTLPEGDGAPAFVRHLEMFQDTDRINALLLQDASFPVHPTQLYEAVAGLFLLVMVLVERRTRSMRGQNFFTFVFAYGVLRFVLEIFRDDVERGEYGLKASEHLLIPGALLALAVGFIFGIGPTFRRVKVRFAACAAALAIPLCAYVALKPRAFGPTTLLRLSTSQWIALVTAVSVSYSHARLRQTSPALNSKSMNPSG